MFRIARHLPVCFVLAQTVILYSPVKVTQTLSASNSNHMHKLRLVYSDVDLEKEESKSPTEE